MSSETPQAPQGSGAPAPSGGPRPAYRPSGGGRSSGDRDRPRYGSGGDRGDRERGPGGRRPRRKVCVFCVDHVKKIDYKDVSRIRRYISERGKIDPRRKIGTCAKHQRMLTAALKRARHMAMLPYTAEHVRAMMSPQARAMAGGPPPPKPERTWRPAGAPFQPGGFRPAGAPFTPHAPGAPAPSAAPAPFAAPPPSAAPAPAPAAPAPAPLPAPRPEAG